MSVMSFSSAWPLERMMPTCSRCSGDSGESARICAKPDDPVDRGADFVADDGEELALGAVRGFGGVLGVEQRSLGFLADGNVVADRLVFQRVAVVVLDRALGPHHPAAAVVPQLDFALEGVGLVADGGARREKGEGLADELVAFAAEGGGVGAVDEGELAVEPVAADQIDLILDDAAVAGLGLLQGLRHALNVAREADDFVVVGFTVGVSGRGFVGGLPRGGAQGFQPLGQGAIPDVTGEHEQDAADDRTAEDVELGAEPVAQLFVVYYGGDDGGQGEDEECFLLLLSAMSGG